MTLVLSAVADCRRIATDALVGVQQLVREELIELRARNT